MKSHSVFLSILFYSLNCLAGTPELDKILSQTGGDFPKTWGERNGAPVPADYEMDPEITKDPRYRELLPKAFASLPSLNITMSNDDLFGTEKGIYVHPMESGDAWERPARAELVGTNGSNIFNVSCGIRIHGGWNRRPEESPKHAFRLVFKKQYGPGKLKAPLFGNDAATEFDTLVLRAGCNNTWLHWRSIERLRGDYLRDQWMRDTQRAMGHLSPHGIFVHLFLNGLYWGLYNIVERPDESFAAAYLGGARKDYDSRNSDKVLSGDAVAWNELMRLINAEVKGDSGFERVAELLEIENFADYILLNHYGANADWDHASNWYAARRRDSGKWRFFVWDAERTLEDPTDNMLSFDDDQSPSRIFQRLRENETFRKIFAERARKHFAGVLSATATAKRYGELAQVIELAIIAESARWGDYRRDVHPYREGPYELYTPEMWQREVARLISDYFPMRTENFTSQLKSTGLAN